MATYAEAGAFQIATTRQGTVEVRLAGEGRAKDDSGATVLTLSLGEVADFLAALVIFQAP